MGPSRLGRRLPPPCRCVLLPPCRLALIIRLQAALAMVLASRLVASRLVVIVSSSHVTPQAPATCHASQPLAIPQAQEFKGPPRLQALPYLFTDTRVEVHCPGRTVRRGDVRFGSSPVLGAAAMAACSCCRCRLLRCSAADLPPHGEQRKPTRPPRSPRPACRLRFPRTIGCLLVAAWRKCEQHTPGGSMPGAAWPACCTARPTAQWRPAPTAPRLWPSPNQSPGWVRGRAACRSYEAGSACTDEQLGMAVHRWHVRHRQTLTPRCHASALHALIMACLPHYLVAQTCRAL